jgi:beta-lactamase superfamily II metal-dependent hydrolase
MSIVKSFSVGEGDTFYIDHNSDNFTIIDCCLSEANKKAIVDEITKLSSNKGISRFISTHPDDDHICGLDYLDGRQGIINFYCVKNESIKKDETTDFKKYCELRDSDKAFYIFKGCSRRWMNLSDDERKSSGISILWPDRDNEFFKDALKDAKGGKSPNNISPIIQYSLENGATVLWMGDLEKGFMDNVKNELDLNAVDILFAPHHGRKSGRVPTEILEKLNPKIIVVGEAPSEDLEYYSGYNTITQNTAGDIIFECLNKKVHIYVSNKNYKVTFLNDEKANSYNYYLGTLKC